MKIAIDGPSGAGKSTLCQTLAQKLKFVYVDTGAMYRAIGLYMLQNAIDINNEQQVTAALPLVQVDLKYENEKQRMYLAEADISDDIRAPEVSMAASTVSKYPEVRAFLLNLQRSLASKGNVLMDGRDIGTVVLPDADIKIFLTAAQDDRAQRRYKELLSYEREVTYEEVLRDIEKRDFQDSNRKVAPLKPADDAIVVDTTGNTFEESLQVLLKLIEERM